MDVSYKQLYERIAEEKRVVEDEHKVAYSKFESELRGQSAQVLAFANEKAQLGDQLSKLQFKYERSIAEVTELRNTQRRSEAAAFTENADLAKLRVELNQVKTDLSQKTALLEYYQKDNERIKRDLSDLRSFQPFVLGAKYFYFPACRVTAIWRRDRVFSPTHV